MESNQEEEFVDVPETVEESEEKKENEEEKEEDIPEIIVHSERDYNEALEHKNEGNAHFKEGRYNDSISCYSSALEACPDLEEYKKDISIFYANRAAAEIELNQYEEACKDCDQAIEKQPNYIKAYIRRATCYEKLDKLDELQADYAKILELDPSLREYRLKKEALDKKINERNEKLKEEMLSKLKGFGNKILGKFGMSLDNFKMEQDPKTGGYNIKFQQ
ncbi:hypothetical protein WA158_001035 [Blastocystis sp. Blastoise]